MNENVIFVGSKPFMNYVNSIATQFTVENANQVTVKARGKFISTAVSVVEVITKRFLKEQVGVKDIKINSEDLKNKEGKIIRVSTIEVLLAKL